MVFAGHYAAVGSHADSVFHQARKAWKAGHRRIHVLLVKLAIKNNLAFGDVACKVWNRVRDVVVGHRQNRNLRDASFASLYAAGPFVQFGKVGIKVARIAFSAGNLAARRGNFAQGFAIVCHVGHNDQDVHSLFVSQILRGGKSAARRDYALNAGSVGQGLEHDYF